MINYKATHGNKNFYTSKVLNDNQNNNDDIGPREQPLFNPYQEILQFFESISNDDIVTSKLKLRNLLTLVQQDSEQLSIIFMETQFIPFIFNVLNSGKPLQSIILRLFVNILIYIPSLISYIWSLGLLDLLISMMTSNPSFLKGTAALSMIQIFFDSYGDTYPQLFCPVIYPSFLLGLFKQYESYVQKTNKRKLQNRFNEFFRTVLNITSQYTKNHIPQEEYSSALEIIIITINSVLCDLYYLVSKILLNFLHTNNFKYDDYKDIPIIHPFLLKELANGYPTSKELATTFLLELNEKWPASFPFSIDSIFNNIDNANSNTIALNFQLLTSIIKNDEIDGEYIRYIFGNSSQKNEFPLKTISIQICTGDFKVMESALSCLFFLFQRVTKSNILFLCDNCVFEALIYLLDKEDDELTRLSLQCLWILFDYLRTTEFFQDRVSAFLHLNGFTLLENCCENPNKDINSIAERLFEILEYDDAES